MSTMRKYETVCPVCKTKLNIVYYQRRAADEPPDKVVYCSKCPLDTSRLSFSTSSSVPVQSIKKRFCNERNNSIKLKKDFASTLTKVATQSCIIVLGNAALMCYKYNLNKNSKPEPMIAISATVHTETKPVISDYFLSSSTKNEVRITTSSSKIAPLVSLEKVDIYSSSNNTEYCLNSTDKRITGYEYRLPNITNSRYTVLRTLHDGQQPYILAVLEDEDDRSCLASLESILVKYGTELSIKSIVGNTVLNALYIQSGKAYDWPSAPNNGYTYAWKPDGERFWYVKYGSIWLFSRRLLSGRIAGWNICSSLQSTTVAGPILDVEVMIGFPPILIDVLVNSSGQSMPVSRTLDSVLDEFKFTIDSGLIDIPIYVREYFRSEKELLQTKDKLEYPVDGVVGVQDGSMTIIKLKDEKSIELKLCQNGDLVSKEDNLVATSNLQLSEEVGSIIELRFVRQSRSDSPTITEVFRRTDKTTANDLQACKNIFSAISDTPDSLARRNVVQWCTSIRRKLNQIASKSTGRGRVIVDIGAGDGQAVSDYSDDPEVTYLLLEPDMRKCSSMLRRLHDANKNSSRLYKSPSDIMNALRLLIPKKIKYAIVCTTLKKVLDQKDCIRTLKTCVRYCIASFSISYVASELQELVIEGLNVVGCGYMYDSVDEHGTLIDEHGVVMKYASYKNAKGSVNATVQWGMDKIYIENAITLRDFQEAFYCKPATNLVPIVADSKTSLLSTVSSKVYIISSSKYSI